MTVDMKSVIKFLDFYDDREIAVICRSLVAARCVSSFMPFTESNREKLIWQKSDLINYINAVDEASNGRAIDKLDIKTTLLAIMQTINQFKMEFSVELKYGKQ